jgi:pimeloyl-ACP methyl ester carboxylesterase
MPFTYGGVMTQELTLIETPVRIDYPVHYRTIHISGVDIFYREAGAETAPVILLLHGFPTSSNMFRNLIPRLAGSFRLIAPDFPGFGLSGMPEPGDFVYTFENYAGIIDQLAETLGPHRYAIYLTDYGAPVGCRLALMHPERVTALIVQNGNAYETASRTRRCWTPPHGGWTK